MGNTSSKEDNIIIESLLITGKSLFDRIYKIRDHEKEGSLSNEALFSEIFEIIRCLEEEDDLFAEYKNHNNKRILLMIIEMMENMFPKIPLFGSTYQNSKLYSLKRLKARIKNMHIKDLKYEKIIFSGFEMSEEDIKTLRETHKNKVVFTRNAFYYAFLTNLENEIEKSDSKSERNALIDYKYNTIFFESFYERELLKAKYDIRKVDIEKIEGLSVLSKLTMTELKNVTSETGVSIAFNAVKELQNKNYLERLKNNKSLLKCYILYLKTALNFVDLEGIIHFKRKMESVIKSIPSILDYQDAINEILELVERILKERKEETGFTIVRIL